MSSQTLAKPKNKNSTAFSPVFGKKLSERTSTSDSTNSSHDVLNPRFGHNFGNIQVESGQSFKQPCPLSLSCPTHCPFGGACHTCPPRIQTKLKIGKAGDKYEQEADRIAEQVMRIPATTCSECNEDEEGVIQTKPIAEKITHLDNRQTVPRKEEMLHTKEAEGETLKATTDLDSTINSLKGDGQKLSQEERRFFEPRFGFSFSKVRIHTNSVVGQIAREIKAHAFTHQNNIVFSQGKYTPGSFEGRRLLAHELTHTLQQARDPALRRTIMRRCAGRWDNAPNECSDVAADQWIERVVVEQEEPQSVTLHWKDGRIESDTCSTGKGQCCVDPASPEGVACSVTGSRRNGSNCTPITEARGYPIRNRCRSNNGWDFWSDFVTSRGIGLHTYPTLDGTPLSHGCVRLNRNHARRIFCGARQNQTHVQVHGFARPSCSHAKLIDEWVSDVSYARQPTDGENVTESLRSGILATRRTLRSAFGETQYQQFMSGLMPSRQQIAAKIPRCSQRALLPSAEESRLIEPVSPGGTVPAGILEASGFDRFLVPFTRDLRGAASLARSRWLVRQHGRSLWNAAVNRAQSSQSGSTDDRPIYWARLQMTRALRQWQARFSLSGAQRNDLMDLFERASRGMDTARFRGGEDVKKILISGFDPFQLGTSAGIPRGNPSGAAVLALDGRRISTAGVTAEIQGAIFPVRFADFNAGLVERFFRPHLQGGRVADMIMTISMGGSQDFEAEEFAGRGRSTPAPGNLGQAGGGTRQQPVVPPGLAAGPEFLRTTLPTSAIRTSLGRTAPLSGEREITEIPAGQTQPQQRLGGPTSGSTAVSGSGGGYLSNEIFYRTALLRLSNGAQIPVGHLHTPLLAPPGTTAITSTAFEQARNSIVQSIQSILRATLPHL